jgi:hypothetical protein
MIWCFFVEFVTEKVSQGHPILAVPGDAAFGRKTFQVTEEEHPEINPGRDRGPAAFGEERPAFLLKPRIETVFIEKPVEFCVKRVTASRNEVCMGDPERLLFGFLTLADCHEILLPGWFPVFYPTWLSDQSVCRKMVSFSTGC